jgi:hypothetical protein
MKLRIYYTMHRRRDGDFMNGKKRMGRMQETKWWRYKSTSCVMGSLDIANPRLLRSLAFMCMNFGPEAARFFRGDPGGSNLRLAVYAVDSLTLLPRGRAPGPRNEYSLL